MVYFLRLLIFIFVLYFANCDQDDNSELKDYVSQETFEYDDNNEVIKKTEKEFQKNGHNFHSSNENNNTSICRSSYDEQSVVNSTTESNKCGYQGNTAEEESDEYSTLVNYPFSVSIQRKGAHYATGALVNKRWIVTVAREFYNVRESIKLFRARLGSVDCKRGGVILPFKILDIHPSYKYGKPSFDLALLKLGHAVNFTKFIKPINLSKIRADIANAKFMITYWPRILVQGKVLPESARERTKYNSMRVSTQRLIPWPECKKNMKSFNENLGSASFCLKPVKSHHSVCMPDVGAPVVAEDGLWGITSGWTPSTCPQNPGPTIFTRLSSPVVRSWLEANLFDLGG